MNLINLKNLILHLRTEQNRDNINEPLKTNIKNALSDVNILISQNKELAETNVKLRQLLSKFASDICDGNADKTQARMVLNELTKNN